MAAKRDRKVTRAIHKLFWDANFVDTPGLIICYVMRVSANVLFNILIPVQIAYALQAIITQHFDRVETYIWHILLLAVGYCITWSIGGWYIVRNAGLGAAYVQRKVFANYLQKDYEFYGNSYFGALGAQAARIRDAFSEYGQLVTLAAPKLITVVVGGIVIIGSKSIPLALLTLLSMTAVLSFTLWSSSWRLRFRRLVGEAASELAGVVGDALSHGSTVKSFASESYEGQRLEKTLKPWVRAQTKSWRSSIPADSGRMMLAAIATCVLLALTARLYQQEAISIAVVALVQLYVIRMIGATQDIAEAIKSFEAVMGASYQPVATMLIEPSIIDDPKPRKLPRGSLDITFDNVTYGYDEAQSVNPAVCNFSLTIKPGEKIGIVGYSGSGKTTLTKLLLRFMDVTDGVVKLGGVDIRAVAQKDLREHIAYVPQEPLLFHRSIGENIAYGKPSASNATMRAAAKTAYVDEFAEELPKGYDTLVGERGVKLSGGQRQRVAIARALLKEAPILVLDEATSALDSRSEKFIQRALWQLMKDRTALVIAHRLSTIQRMDRIVVMDKGKIVQIGTHEQLLATKGIYASLWSHQSGGYLGGTVVNDAASTVE